MTRASGSVVQPRTSTRAGTSSKKKPGISNSKTAPVDTAPDTDHLSGVSDAERVSMVTEIATRLGEGGDVDDPQRLSSSLRTLGVLLRTGSQKSKGLRRVTDALVIPALLLRELAGGLKGSGGYAAQGQAVVAVLAGLARGRSLADRIARSGHIVGLWREPLLCAPYRRVGFRTPFRVPGTRDPPRLH